MNEVNKKESALIDEKQPLNVSSVKMSEKSPSVFLVETFYITTRKNNVFQVRLTEKGLCLRKENNGSLKEQTILIQDIIGVRCLRSKRKIGTGSPCACSSLPGPGQLKVVDENSMDLDETDSSAYLYIYAYILKKSRRSGIRRERTTLTLRFRSFDRYDDNNREAQKWRTAIKQLINGETPLTPSKFVESRRMLIILNPKSGSGKGRELFQQRVATVFIEAEIPYDLQVTKKANFAREFVRVKDIYAWRGIVVVGGDGIFWEVINGLLEREDWERALSETPIGIIPCGSGNGLARSIAHEFDEPFEPKPILGATLTAVRGKRALMDLVRVETRSQIMYSFLSVGWGLISDIDIESERLRPIGYQRFALWSVHRLINLRTYHGKVSYLPIQYEPHESNEIKVNYKQNSLKHSMSCNTALDCPECHGEGDCETCDTGFGDVLSLETSSISHSFRPRMDSWYSASSKKTAYFSTTESVYHSIAEKHSDRESLKDNNSMVQVYGPASSIPALTTPVPSNWVTIIGEFVMVHTATQSHLGSDCFFSPSSKLNDGIIWMLIIRAGVSRSQLLSFMLGLSSGTHMPTTKNEYIQMIPVSAFRIEPQSGEGGHLTVDGERVEYGSIQGEIFPGLAKVMVPIFS